VFTEVVSLSKTVSSFLNASPTVSVAFSKGFDAASL
jgi:hypothetical protein